jgi:hypothetical protein
MTIKAHEFDLIVKKFQFTTRKSGDLLVWLEYEGKVVVRTKRSNIKGRDLPFQDAIRSQLHLNKTELRQAIGCSLGFEEYIALLKTKGLL